MSAQLCLPLFVASADFEVGRLQAARLEGMYDGAIRTWSEAWCQLGFLASRESSQVMERFQSRLGRNEASFGEVGDRSLACHVVAGRNNIVAGACAKRVHGPCGQVDRTKQGWIGPPPASINSTKQLCDLDGPSLLSSVSFAALIHYFHHLTNDSTIPNIDSTRPTTSRSPAARPFLISTYARASLTTSFPSDRFSTHAVRFHSAATAQVLSGRDT